MAVEKDSLDDDDSRAGLRVRSIAQWSSSELAETGPMLGQEELQLVRLGL